MPVALLLISLPLIMASWLRGRVLALLTLGHCGPSCCCYFRTRCSALSVPCRLQELTTPVRPFVMCQNWCWSSGSSASCLCFCSAFLLWEVKSGSELETGGLCPSPSRNLSSLCRIAFSMPQGPSAICLRDKGNLVKNTDVSVRRRGTRTLFLAPNRWRKRASLTARAPLEKSPQSCAGEIQGIRSAFSRGPDAHDGDLSLWRIFVGSHKCGP